MNKITAYIKQHKIFAGYWGVIAVAVITDLETLAAFLAMCGWPWFILNCIYPFKRFGITNRAFAFICLAVSLAVFIFVTSGGNNVTTTAIQPQKPVTRPKPTPEQIAANVKAAKERQKILEQQAKEAAKNKITPPPALTEPLKESNAQAMAITICNDAVENSLRSPSTADFPFWGGRSVVFGDVVTYKSYVDSQNGFGAMIRSYFTCQIQYRGGKQTDFNNWSIIKLKFSE